MNTTALIGALRFQPLFEAERRDLSVKGHIVLSPGHFDAPASDTEALRNSEAAMRVIDLCDEVLVINHDDYIGEGTAHLLGYARGKGRAVRWKYPTRRAEPGEAAPAQHVQTLVEHLQQVVAAIHPDGVLKTPLPETVAASKFGFDLTLQVVDLVLVQALVNVPEAERRWPDIRRAISASLPVHVAGHAPDLTLERALVSGDLDYTSFITLGGLLGSQETALCLMATLIALGRAKRMTILDLPGMDDMDIDQEVMRASALEKAGRGMLSLRDVTLDALPGQASRLILPGML